MGIVAVGAVVVAVVFVIAAVVIGREARRLDAMPARVTVDLDESVLWVAERLPDDVTAQLSYSDVRRILDWHLGYLAAKGVEVMTPDPRPVEIPVVLDDIEALDHVLLNAAEVGADYTPEQIRAVLAVQLGYLDEVGAVGPPAPNGDEDGGNTPGATR